MPLSNCLFGYRGLCYPQLWHTTGGLVPPIPSISSRPRGAPLHPATPFKPRAINAHNQSHSYWCVLWHWFIDSVFTGFFYSSPQTSKPNRDLLFTHSKSRSLNTVNVCHFNKEFILWFSIKYVAQKVIERNFYITLWLIYILTWEAMIMLFGYIPILCCLFPCWLGAYNPWSWDKVIING